MLYEPEAIGPMAYARWEHAEVTSAMTRPKIFF
jgi:hypothetical protein